MADEGATVDRAWAEAFQGFDVLLRAVAFITGEAVLRILRVVRLHELIPRHFREVNWLQ